MKPPPEGRLRRATKPSSPMQHDRKSLSYLPSNLLSSTHTEPHPCDIQPPLLAVLVDVDDHPKQSAVWPVPYRGARHAPHSTELSGTLPPTSNTIRPYTAPPAGFSPAQHLLRVREVLLHRRIRATNRLRRQPAGARARLAVGPSPGPTATAQAVSCVLSTTSRARCSAHVSQATSQSNKASPGAGLGTARHLSTCLPTGRGCRRVVRSAPRECRWHIPSRAHPLTPSLTATRPARPLQPRPSRPRNH